MSTNQRTFDELAERARLLRAGGATYKQIKAELGVRSSSTISRMLGVAGKARPASARSGDPRTGPRAAPGRPERAGDLPRAGHRAKYCVAHHQGHRVDAVSRRAEAGRRYWRSRNEQRDLERRNAHAEAAAQVGELSDRELLLLGVVLYWAEGSKAKPWRRNDEWLRFINSDPDVIRLYLAWLVLLGVAPERLSFRVHIHESADIPAAER